VKQWRATSSPTGVGRALDDAPPSIFHLKAAIVSGMGFFTDAYDLNVISTVLLLLKPEFHLSAGQVGLVGSTALASRSAATTRSRRPS
jgi:MFS transporter, PHS family, inorganic phosphate transporter